MEEEIRVILFMRGGQTFVGYMPATRYGWLLSKMHTPEKEGMETVALESVQYAPPDNNMIIRVGDIVAVLHVKSMDRKVERPESLSTP